jgi:formate dehydrogenase
MNSWLNDNKTLFQNHRGNALEIHPDDAEQLGLIEGFNARVSSSAGSIEVPVKLAAGGRRGVVTIPHGWGSRVFNPGQSESIEYGVNRNILVPNQSVDPLSQIAAFNAVPVHIEPVHIEPVHIAPAGSVTHLIPARALGEAQ